MENVSELVQREVKAYVTKNSRKLKVFREPSNLQAFATWMNAWPIAKEDQVTLSPRDGDSISPLLAPQKVSGYNPQA